MIHLYNENKSSIDVTWLRANGYLVGKPKATRCMTVEKLEALDIIGVYGHEETD